jgi:hypothetical protein
MKNEESNHMMPGPADSNKPDSPDNLLRAMLNELDQKASMEKLPADFLTDASEGLHQVKDEKELAAVIQKLNKEMHQHLTHVKTKRLKRSIGNLNWTYWAVILIILLTIISFIVIRMQLKSR